MTRQRPANPTKADDQMCPPAAEDGEEHAGDGVAEDRKEAMNSKDLRRAGVPKLLQAWENGSKAGS